MEESHCVTEKKKLQLLKRVSNFFKWRFMAHTIYGETLQVCLFIGTSPIQSKRNKKKEHKKKKKSCKEEIYCFLLHAVCP